MPFGAAFRVGKLRSMSFCRYRFARIEGKDVLCGERWSEAFAIDKFGRVPWPTAKEAMPWQSYQRLKQITESPGER